MNRESSRHVTAPVCEALESRKLLAVAHHTSPAMTARFEAITAAAQVKADVNRLAADVRTMQAGSQITPAEFAAVARDVVACQQVDATPTGDLSASQASQGIIELTAYAALHGVDTADDWAVFQSDLASDFAALGHPVPAPVLDQLMTDLEAMAASGGVSTEANNRFSDDEAALQADFTADPAASQKMDPFLYFENHFAGFVKGGPRTHLPTLVPAGYIASVRTPEGVEWLNALVG